MYTHRKYTFYIHVCCYAQSALVGLHLKSGSSRTDLTIIYFQWSDNKRRIVASVAELKTHLVKQIQVCMYVCMYVCKNMVSFRDEWHFPRSVH